MLLETLHQAEENLSQPEGPSLLGSAEGAGDLGKEDVGLGERMGFGGDIQASEVSGGVDPVDTSGDVGSASEDSIDVLDTSFFLF
jgi:hypothetical protein